MIAIELGGMHPDEVAPGMRATVYHYRCGRADRSWSWYSESLPSSAKFDDVDGRAGTWSGPIRGSTSGPNAVVCRFEFVERPATVKSVEVRDVLGRRFVNSVVVALDDETRGVQRTINVETGLPFEFESTSVAAYRGGAWDATKYKLVPVEEPVTMRLIGGFRLSIADESDHALATVSLERRLALTFLCPGGGSHDVGVMALGIDNGRDTWPNARTRNEFRRLVGDVAERRAFGSDEELDQWLIREQVRAVELGELAFEIQPLSGIDPTARRLAKALSFGARWSGDGSMPAPLTVRERSELLRSFERGEITAAEADRVLREGNVPYPPTVPYWIRFGSWPVGGSADPS